MKNHAQADTNINDDGMDFFWFGEKKYYVGTIFVTHIIVIIAIVPRHLCDSCFLFMVIQ